MLPLPVRLRLYALILAFAFPGSVSSQAGQSIRVRWEGIETFQNAYSYAGRNSAALGLANDYWHITVVKFVYIVDTDFQGRDHVVSHTLSWVAQGSSLSDGYESITCSGHNDLDLVGSIVGERDSKLRVPCERKVFANYFGFFPKPPDRIQVPKIVGWDKLRKDFSYSEEKTFPSGEQYTYTIKASRMETCADRVARVPGTAGRAGAGFINDGDPAIVNVDIHIEADKSTIKPDTQTSLKIKVTCDQVPINGAELELKIHPQERSGGHMHTDQRRPGGVLNDTKLDDDKASLVVKTGENGMVSPVVKFEPPGKPDPKQPPFKNVGIAGIYTVKATYKSKNILKREDTATIDVRFTDLVELVASPDAYYDICGCTTCLTCKPSRPPSCGEGKGADGTAVLGTAAHPHGNYGTARTLNAFKSVARDFYQTQEQHNDKLKKSQKACWNVRKVSFNDIGLASGGLFDWKSTWHPPHQTHGRGQGGDVNHFYESGKLVDWNGAKVNFDDWLVHTLFEVANKYGHWDSYDVGLNAGTPVQETDFKRGPDWHLHIED